MMKKKWWLLAMSAVCALSLAACSDPADKGNTDVPGPGPGIIVDETVPATSISLDKSSLVLEAGKSETLTATVAPDNTTDKVEWKSSDTSVATVSNGTVTAVKVGTAMITVTAGEKSAKCSVTVTEPVRPAVPATGISLDKTELTLEYGKTSALVATLTPEDATDTVVWTTSNGNVATVANGTVTAVGIGEATVTATAGEYSASCDITVPTDLVVEQGYIWSEDFSTRDTVPGYLGVTQNAGGAATMTDEGLSLTTGTQSGKSVFVDYDFDSVLTGTVRVQMRIKFGNVAPFNNILFFLTESGENAATVAMDNGKYHNNHAGNSTSNKWAPIIDDFDVAADVWQDVELIINTESGLLGFYVTDGENSAYAVDQPMRVPANKNAIKKFRIGGDKSEIDMVVQYIKISAVSGPELTVTQPAEDFELDLNDSECDGTYTLEYSATSDVQDTLGYAVTCDKTSGFTLGEDKKTLTFTAAGEYTFTVTATDKYGSASDTVTVSVKGNKIAPSITLTSEESVTLSLQAEGGAQYTFEYAIEGSPVPTEEVFASRDDYFTDAEDGVIKSGTTVTFLSAGVYTFTVEATNGETPTAVKTVTVTVTDRYAFPATPDASKFVYQNTFDNADGLTARNGGNANGAYTVDDGSLHITTNGTNNANYLFDMALGKALNGINSAEIEFALNSDNINFTNVMFLQPLGATDPETATACFAIEGNKLKAHSGSSWFDVKYGGYSVGLQKDVVYKLRAVLDMGNNVTHLYLTGSAINLVESNSIVAPQELEGEVYLGTVKFRVQNGAISVLRTGSNRANIDYKVYSVNVYRFTPDLAVNENNVLVHTGSYQFKYSKESGANVVIACDDDSVSISGDTATFTKPGKYTFTLTASNDFGAAVQTVTLICADDGKAATLLGVDFTDSATRPEAPTGNNTNAVAEYTEDGLRLSTTGGSGSIYYQTVFDEVLTGWVVADVTFSIAATNNQFINMIFFDGANDTNPACAYAVAASGYVQHTPRAGSWQNQQYNGSDIILQKGSQYTYTMRVVADFDSGISYLYLLGSNIKLAGSNDEIELPEEGLYIASNAFRWSTKVPQKFMSGIDSKSGVDYTLKSVSVKSYAAGKNDGE